DFAGSCRRAAQPGIQGNSNVRCETARVRSHDQVARISRIDHVKARPVISGHLFMKAVGDSPHECLGGGGSGRMLFEILEKLSLERCHPLTSYRNRDVLSRFGGRSSPAVRAVDGTAFARCACTLAFSSL